MGLLDDYGPLLRGRPKIMPNDPVRNIGGLLDPTGLARQVKAIPGRNVLDNPDLLPGSVAPPGAAQRNAMDFALNDIAPNQKPAGPLMTAGGKMDRPLRPMDYNLGPPGSPGDPSPLPPTAMAEAKPLGGLLAPKPPSNLELPRPAAPELGPPRSVRTAAAAPIDMTPPPVRTAALTPSVTPTPRVSAPPPPPPVPPIPPPVVPTAPAVPPPPPVAPPPIAPSAAMPPAAGAGAGGAAGGAAGGLGGILGAIGGIAKAAGGKPAPAPAPPPEAPPPPTVRFPQMSPSAPGPVVDAQLSGQRGQAGQIMAGLLSQEDPRKKRGLLA